MEIIISTLFTTNYGIIFLGCMLLIAIIFELSKNKPKF